MFEPSEKVIVLTSSSTGLAGAKRGSIGYVKPNSSKVYLSAISRELSICASLLDLMIVRYGFGKERKRHEPITVINVFPIFSKLPSRGRVNDVKDFIDKIKEQNFSSNKWVCLKTRFGRASKLEVCVAAPIIERRISILKVNKINFSAWFESVMWSDNFRIGLQQLRDKPLNSRYDSGIRDYIIALKRCLTDRTYKERLIAAAMDSWTVRQRLVEAIKFMNSVSASSAMRIYKLRISNSYKKGSHNKGPRPLTEFLYPTLIKGIFSDHLFEYNCELMSKYGMANKELRYHVEKTRMMLREEAQALFCVKN